MSRTNTVEGLLIEVRDEYSRSMKQAIIDYKRRDPEEEAKMANLSLPPPPVTPKVPYLAVVPTPPKEVSIKKMISTVEEKHFTVHPESTQVILALFKSWEAVKPGRFLATEELPIPMTLYEYQDQQDTHFSNVRDQLVNDWRSLIVNLIRDNLTNVFQLFVNDQEEYNNSELKRFLKMVTFMLRDQLAEMVSESIHHFVTYFERYADPVAPKETSAKNQTDGDTNDFSVLDGYLGEPRLQTEVDPNRPSTTFVLPIFVFKMSTLNGQVIFLPPLDSIEVSIMTMLSIPGKIQNLCQIDNEVVPLLGIGEVPLCTSQSVPKIFQQTEQAKKRCKEIINDNFIQPKALAALYQQYGHLLEVNAEEYVNEWFYPTPKRKEVEKVQTEEEEEDQWGDDVMAKPEEEVEEVVHHSVQETRDEIQKFMTYVEDIQNLSPSEVVFRMIKIDCHMVKEQLTAKSREIAQKLMEGLAKQVNEHSNSISKEFEEMLTFIKTRSTNVEQLAELKTRSVEIENKEVPRLQGEIRAMQETLGVLDSFEYSITREDFNLSWSVVRYPQSVIEAMEETKMQIEFDNARFQKELQAEQTQFQANLEDFAKEVETFRDFGVGTTAQMEQNAAKVELLQEKLDKADELVKSFNQRDVLFGDIPTEYTELAELRAQFTPYFQLWSTTSLFNASYSLWMTGPFMELDATNIEKDVSAWYKLMFKLEKELQADEAVKPARVASEMKDKINAFKENVPIIQWLRSPGLRPRHWDQISHTLAPGRVTLTPDNDLTLSHILALDVDKHKEAIEDISSAAEKEYALEQSLDKMLKEWKAMDLTLEEYKATNTYIMKGSDDILTLLDDQIMKTQAMRGSPYIKPFEVQTKKWEAKLQLLSQIMEEWLTCQKTWIYLEPIFSSEDIMRQMPIEGRRFGVVDAYWRKTMEAATRTPNILDFVSETDNLLKTFQESNKMLDLIGKGLNEYLETKRLAFPRFYFLSNDELLSILSQTKNATAVQPHLGKCFDAVHRLQFTDEKQIITGMSSNEGEFVAFHEHVNPNEGAKKGNVEIWLKDVEQVIFAVIKRLTRKAIGDYANSAREDWILAQPGQVVLSVSQLFFTREVTAALAKGGSKGLEEYTKQMAQQMEKLVELVRGDLTALNRLTLGALTVMDVHARDVVLNLVKEGVSDPTEFEWLAQLRYYWEEDPSNPSQKPGLGATGLENDVPTGVQPDKNGFIVPDGIMKVRMVMSELLYGYEYLGNSGRLVITPLTDRCYRTLIGAVHLNLGGAPEGPAGTGKTETVKDLAKAVAIQCIVQNGSDGLNYRSMAKFFKGLASSGSWVCFDEFNRIPLEVLSVVAQQVSSIQRAINEDKHTFFFDNINIPLIHTCSIFITMNPGYAGRAELPDNLKVLFRTVAMMIPDYAMIAEITLYSMGYSAATDLARKTVACLRLSSEQLSSQDHYDFGMRNLNSILVAAGALRRVEPDTPEDILCLRALRDCNVPKFVAADIPLFLGIVQDLFPTTVVEEKHNEVLVAALTEQCKKTNLQPTPSFIHKCLQLYDTFIVRHGLMVVGHAFAGKSSCIRTLGESLKALKDTANEGADVKYLTVNPKSVSLDQLYGADDPATNEWHDGVLPVVFREAVDMPLDTWKWVWFDGPVDALWIENMNTVLDGNKKLCLASGEQIKLVNRMAMLFEVQDLAVASPATVSRCGMVYMEPGELGWEPILASWLDTLPEQLTENRDNLKTLFDWVIPPCLFFLRKQTTSVIPTSEIGMVKNLTNIFSCLIRRLLSEKGKDSKGTSSEMGVMLECIFMFSLVWSLGVQTDTEGRKKFSQFAQSILTGEAPEGAMIPKEYADMKVRQPFPLSDKNGQYTYDFCLNMKLCKWEHWMETAPEFQVPDGARFNDIIVPTIDTVRTSWLLDLLILGRAHVLLVGNTGTGKSVGVSQKLLRDMPKTNYLSMSLTFSARTSVNQTQDIIDNKLERRRAGIFGPPPGRRSVIFVDDLNMPLLEEYGAQPPIELLRQWMDYGGWYERKTNQFKKIVDVQFLAAMGPPGGGRNPVTYRYLRHYNSICLVPYDDNSLKRIYTVVVGWWLDSFSGRVRLLKQSLVDATVDIYNTVTRELLPTPAKSHYTFNLRDISKVFQGVTLGQAEHIQEPNDLIRLWVHECSRVFKDRLVNKEDLSWFEACIGSQVQKHFKTKIDDVTDVKRSLIYADFSDPRSVKKPYIEIDDVDALTRVVEGYLTDYNNIEKTQMNLVMFTAAIEHVSRINRIIRQPYGNALLIGVGGSGRQSLTRLASFIADYEVFQIEVNKNYGVTEWQEDLRDVLRKAGILNKPMVFLFTDSQIQNEGFIEDINNILNNGEVPNLFPPEEYMPIVEQCRADASKAGKAESNASVFSYFVERCKENIHMVLCFSPVGDSFRNRLRMFPSLVNCTTIDWFHPWPTDALKSVASRFFKDIDVDQKTKEGIIDVCVDMQERVIKTSESFYNSLRRYNYVTPTSYLELIKIFRNLFEAKRTEIFTGQQRYENGLQKLNETAVSVKKMQIQLEALQPQLIQSSKETEELIVTIEERSKQVAETKRVVSAEEAECNEQAAEAEKIKEECTEALAEAMPALNNAMKALKVVQKSQLDELRAMKVPTPGVLMTIEALCIMMGVAPVKVGQVGKKTDDYWTPAKAKLLKDTKFMDRLAEYDKDNIPEKVILRVRPFVKNPEFTPAKIAMASKAAEGFCKWVIAMEIYDRVSKQVGPKREALAAAETKLAAASEQLAEKKAQLKEVQDLLDELNEQFDGCNKKKQDLESQVKECSERLDRAEKLIGGLAGEKDRWFSKAQQLRQDYNNVVGNILVSSGVVAYLGVFTVTFRQSCITHWVNLLKEKDIPCAEEFRLHHILGDPVAIRNWGIQKLPNDDFSIDNAVILSKSIRWGLLIDPQEQANKWIKNMEDADDGQLKVVKQTDDQFIRILSTSVQMGIPILIENLGEYLDPSLEPLLLKLVFKQGNRMMIRVGSEPIEFNNDFRLYMTTKLQNPHYPPETSTKVTLINFMVTQEGLQDQMLGQVVSLEEPELELKRGELIVKNAENQRQLQEIEDKILKHLSEASGNILDDEDLINTLQKSKQASKLIEKRMAAAAQTQEEIAATRLEYRGVSQSVANLFFCISDLGGVDPMYQYSLTWFTNLFARAVKESEKSNDVHVRTNNIDKTFLSMLYANVCRSLFEKDKLLFSFLLCVRVLANRNEMDPVELRFLLTGTDGGVNLGSERENPCDEFDFGEGEGASTAGAGGKWLNDNSWKQVVSLSKLKAFKGFDDYFAENQRQWRAYYESSDPFSRQLPGPWDRSLDLFQKMLVLRCLRPDKLIGCVKTLVTEKMGKQYVTPPPFDMGACYADSSSSSPLIFVLSPGVDPSKEVFLLADQMHMNSPDKLFSISLGQGQGPFAENAIREVCRTSDLPSLRFYLLNFSYHSFPATLNLRVIS